MCFELLILPFDYVLSVLNFPRIYLLFYFFVHIFKEHTQMKKDADVAPIVEYKYKYVRDNGVLHERVCIAIQMTNNKCIFYVIYCSVILR